MNYGQDYVREYLERTVLSGAFCGMVCFGMVMLVLLLLQKHDREFDIRMNGREYAFWAIICACVGGYIFAKSQGGWQNRGEDFLMLMYMMLCCVTDYHTQKAYDAVQLGVCVLLVIGIWGKETLASQGVELIVFGGIQAGIFRRMYGEADTMGFLICALSLLEGGLWIWTLHMAITFLCLGIVQGWKHNIRKDGNLKVPVPLFPYMAAAYVLVF